MTNKCLFILIVTLLFFGCNKKKNPVSNQNENEIIKWKKLSGPEAGAVYCFVENSQGHLFISTNGGVFRTTDNTVTWQKINQGLTHYSVRAIAVDSTGLLICGNDNGEIYTSLNNGNSWTLKTDIGIEIYSIAVNSNGQLFVGTGNGIYRSLDHGENWQQLNIGTNYVYGVFSIKITNNDKILIGTYAGIYTSNSDGNKWTNVGLNYGNRIFAIEINQAGQIFVGMEESTIFRSDDGGGTWLNIANGIPYWASINSIIINDEQEIYAGSQYAGIYFSSDNGNSWNIVSTKKYLQSLYLYQNKYLFAGYYYNGLNLSEDHGSTWAQMKIGLNSLEVSSLVIDSNNRIYACSERSGIYKFVPETNEWSFIGEDFSIYRTIKLELDGSDRVYALTVFNGLFRSSDYGFSWNQLNNSWINFSSSGLAIHKSTGTIYCSNRGKIYKSTNGTDWRVSNTTNGNSFTFGINREVYAGNYNGIYSSYVSSALWKTCTTDLSIIGKYGMATNSLGDLFVCTHYNGMNISTNGGMSFEYCGLEHCSWFESILISEEDDIFVSCRYEGSYFSKDNGQSWDKINDGLSPKPVLVFAKGEDRKIYAGTNGDGIYVYEY